VVLRPLQIEFFRNLLNVGAVFWLLFLFLYMSRGEVKEARSVPPQVVAWACYAIALLLIVPTILGMARAVQEQAKLPSVEERASALRQARRRYPRAALTFIIGLAWMLFIGNSTFGFLRSHAWFILGGIAASVLFGWAVLEVIRRQFNGLH